MTKKYGYLLSLLLLLLCGCDKDNSTSSSPDISGLWVVDKVDGEALLTNDKIFYKIEASQMDESFRDAINEQNSRWEEGVLTYRQSEEMLYVQYPQSGWNFEMRILNSKENSMEWKLEKSYDSSETAYPNITYLFRRLTDDYSKNIVEMWEGQCVTSGDSDELHRWEFLADGTYRYYSKNDLGKWIAKTDNAGSYLLYGDVLVCSWLNDDQSGVKGQNCELWNISIEKDEMRWQATREGDEKIEFVLTKVPRYDDL